MSFFQVHCQMAMEGRKPFAWAHHSLVGLVLAPYKSQKIIYHLNTEQLIEVLVDQVNSAFLLGGS